MSVVSKQTTGKHAHEQMILLLDAIKEDVQVLLSETAEMVNLSDFMACYDDHDFSLIHAFVSPSNLDLVYGLILDLLPIFQHGCLYLLYCLYRTALEPRKRIPVSMHGWMGLRRLRETMMRGSDWNRVFDWLVGERAFCFTMQSPYEMLHAHPNLRTRKVVAVDEEGSGTAEMLRAQLQGTIERVSKVADRYEQAKDANAPQITRSHFASLLRSTLPRPPKTVGKIRRPSSMSDVINAADDMPTLM